jgi:hypothetical protein
MSFRKSRKNKTIKPNGPLCNPLIEYKRFELIEKFKKEFIPIPKFNKLDIYNIFPRWLMNNTNNSLRDPILPLNITKINNTQFIGDIKYNYPNISPNDIDNIIRWVNLPIVCNNIWKSIQIYKKSINDDTVIHKEHKNIFIVLSLNNTNYNAKIPEILYNKIVKKLYSNNISIDIINSFIYCLLIRYNTLDSSNQQLANNPAFYNYLNKHYGVNFELFASGLNSFFPNFCSLYPDLEYVLGSNGNFNNIILNKGFYVANPPFDEQIVLNMTKRLFYFLRKSNDELTFFITIPSDWNDFAGLQLIKNSPFLTFYRVIPKNKAKYFNYNTNKFIFPCSVAFILLQNIKGRELHNLHKFDKVIDKFYS